MNRILGSSLLLLHVLSASAEDKPATPAQQYQALLKESGTAGFALHQATTDDQRKKAGELGAKVGPRLLALAEKYPKDPIAIDVLIQVINQELWLENNTTHPGHGKDNPAPKAIKILLRDHLKSDKLGFAT